jgi:hypothetical protein
MPAGQGRHRHPEHLGIVARLDGEFPGRFVLGLGVSHAKVVEGLDAGHYRRPLAQMVEYLDSSMRWAAPVPTAGSSPPSGRGCWTWRRDGRWAPTRR